MEPELNIILAEIDWFIILGPLVVYICLEIKSDGDGGFGGGGFGGSDDGFGGF